jgi:hypothetical protein
MPQFASYRMQGREMAMSWKDARFSRIDMCLL